MTKAQMFGFMLLFLAAFLAFVWAATKEPDDDEFTPETREGRE